MTITKTKGNNQCINSATRTHIQRRAIYKTQAKNDTENYINCNLLQMAASVFQAANDDAIRNITNILVAVQTFMRGQKVLDKVTYHVATFLSNSKRFLDI